MDIKSFDHLEIRVEAAVGRLILNRPSKLNALSLALINEITAAARWFDRQENVRVVIVSGAGSAFSAGADLEGFPQTDDPSVREAADAGRVMAEAVENMRAITIAQLHGWCVGGGLVLAAACDLRIATQTTQFSIPEVDLGIPLAWGGIPRLVRELGPAITKELVMTCRVFSAEEARALRFLNEVVVEDELANRVLALAENLLGKAFLPLDSTKRHVNAVSLHMGGGAHAWSDADGLLVGLMDEECSESRQQYLNKVLGSRLTEDDRN